MPKTPFEKMQLASSNLMAKNLLGELQSSGLKTFLNKKGGTFIALAGKMVDLAQKQKFARGKETKRQLRDYIIAKVDEPKIVVALAQALLSAMHAGEVWLTESQRELQEAAIPYCKYI